MMLQAFVSGILFIAQPSAQDGLLAIRVGKAETVSQGTLEHAVILIEDGKIVEIGEDLPIERGIRILDRPNWVATPGLVNCHSRAGMDGRAGRGFDPELRASGELYARQDIWRELLEAGVTTLGLYPPGAGIPGQAVAIRPRGEAIEDMLIAEDAYLKINIGASQALKKMLREAFEKLAEYDEKVQKAREKWEKEQEQKKSKSKSKPKKEEKTEEKKEGAEEKKEEEKKEGGLGQSQEEKKKEEEKKEEGKKDESKEKFVPPEPDPKVKPFLELRAGRLQAMMSITKAADYLHLLDVIEKKDFPWFLQVPLRDDIDLYEVAPKIGERGLRVVLTPFVTLQPNTRRERNLPAELQRAGAKIALVPRGDRVEDHERWMFDVGRLVAAGLDRQAALASVTLEPARALGLEERLGSLDKGKDANLVLWSGDPFEPQSRIQAVMLEGRFVHGEVGR